MKKMFVLVVALMSIIIFIEKNKIKSVESAEVNNNERIDESYPTRVVVPTVGIDLPVSESKIIDGYWEVLEDAVSWGEKSGKPGEIGNQVLFAHNKKEYFGPLVNVRKGDFVYIYSTDKLYKYEIVDIKNVTPSDTSVLNWGERDEILTLYTCDGPGDSFRFVAKAIRVQV